MTRAGGACVRRCPHRWRRSPLPSFSALSSLFFAAAVVRVPTQPDSARLSLSSQSSLSCFLLSLSLLSPMCLSCGLFCGLLSAHAPFECSSLSLALHPFPTSHALQEAHNVGARTVCDFPSSSHHDSLSLFDPPHQTTTYLPWRAAATTSV